MDWGSLQGSASIGEREFMQVFSEISYFTHQFVQHALETEKQPLPGEDSEDNRRESTYSSSSASAAAAVASVKERALMNEISVMTEEAMGPQVITAAAAAPRERIATISVALSDSDILESFARRVCAVNRLKRALRTNSTSSGIKGRTRKSMRRST